MNLKAACKRATILTFSSILIIFFGQLILYALQSQHLILSKFEIIFTQTFKYLLEPAGLLIFLLAVSAHLKGLSGNLKTLFIIAGIHIFSGTLISTSSHLTILNGIAGHFGASSSTFYFSIYALMFISGLSLAIFAFIQANGISVSKSLAWVILILNIIICGLVIINFVIFRPWSYHNIMYLIVSMITPLGYLIKLAAIIIFFFAWLKQKPQPPEAGVIDPSPEPVPTLSTKAELPEL